MGFDSRGGSIMRAGRWLRLAGVPLLFG